MKHRNKWGPYALNKEIQARYKYLLDNDYISDFHITVYEKDASCVVTYNSDLNVDDLKKIIRGAA